MLFDDVYDNLQWQRCDIQVEEWGSVRRKRDDNQYIAGRTYLLEAAYDGQSKLQSVLFLA